MNSMISDVDVFCSCMVHGVLAQVFLHSGCHNRQYTPSDSNQDLEEIALAISSPLRLQEAAIYSASVIDNATHFCNFDCHGIAPPEKGNKYPVVNFLLSRSPAISESI